MKALKEAIQDYSPSGDAAGIQTEHSKFWIVCIVFLNTRRGSLPSWLCNGRPNVVPQIFISGTKNNEPPSCATSHTRRRSPFSSLQQTSLGSHTSPRCARVTTVVFRKTTVVTLAGTGERYVTPSLFAGELKGDRLRVWEVAQDGGSLFLVPEMNICGTTLGRPLQSQLGSDPRRVCCSRKQCKLIQET